MRARGRPVLGLVAGLLLGVLIAVDLQQFGVRALETPLLSLTALVGAAIGLAVGLRAPFARFGRLSTKRILLAGSLTCILALTGSGALVIGALLPVGGTVRGTPQASASQGLADDEPAPSRTPDPDRPERYRSTREFRFGDRWPNPGLVTVGPDRLILPSGEGSTGLEYHRFTGIVLERPRVENGYVTVSVGVNDRNGHPEVLDLVLGRPTWGLEVLLMQRKSLGTTAYQPRTVCRTTYVDPPAVSRICGPDNTFVYETSTVQQAVRWLKPDHQYAFGVWTSPADVARCPWDYALDSERVSSFCAGFDGLNSRIARFLADSRVAVRALSRGSIRVGTRLRGYAKVLLVPPSVQ